MRLRLVGLAAAGGVLGYLIETVHRRAGVWTLPPGATMPVWIALVYFAGLLGAGEALRRLDPRAPRGSAFEALVLVVLFFAPPLLHAHELLLTALSTGYLAARLLLAGAPGDLAVALGVAVADLALEGLLVAAGLYHYVHAAWLPLPLWLLPLWAGMALSLRRLFAAARRV